MSDRDVLDMDLEDEENEEKLLNETNDTNDTKDIEGLFLNGVFKGSSDPNHFEINVGKSRIRHKTTLKLNDEFLDRLRRWRHLNSESFYVGPVSFRH